MSNIESAIYKMLYGNLLRPFELNSVSKGHPFLSKIEGLTERDLVEDKLCNVLKGYLHPKFGSIPSNETVFNLFEQSINRIEVLTIQRNFLLGKLDGNGPLPTPSDTAYHIASIIWSHDGMVDQVMDSEAATKIARIIDGVLSDASN